MHCAGGFLFLWQIIVLLIVHNKLKKEDYYNTVSKKEEITSLGDVRLFLDGFKNGDNLYNTVDSIRQDSLRFEKTG